MAQFKVTVKDGVQTEVYKVNSSSKMLATYFIAKQTGVDYNKITTVSA